MVAVPRTLPRTVPFPPNFGISPTAEQPRELRGVAVAASEVAGPAGGGGGGRGLPGVRGGGGALQ